MTRSTFSAIGLSCVTMAFSVALGEGVGAASEETEAALRACALAYPGVIGIDRLMTRKFGSRMYVEMEISVDGSMTLTAAHAIAEGVHSEIERQFPRVKHIMIHVNPEEMSL